MTHDSTKRRWTVAGLTSMAIGAVAIVAGLAAPASAHEGKEPVEIPDTSNKSCATLADDYGIEADWIESKIEAADLPDAGQSATFDLTPEDDSDDAFVTIDMRMQLKYFDWESTVGIDAIYVKGGSQGSYFYSYQPELASYHEDNEGEIIGDGAEETSDIGLGTPPWKIAGKNQISHVTFCWDDEGGEEPPPPTPCPEGQVAVQGGMTGGGDHTPPSEPEGCEPPPEPCPEGQVSAQGGMTDGGDESPPSSECEEPTEPSTPPTEPPPSSSTTVDVNPGVSTTVVNPDTPESTTTTLAITPASDTLPKTGSNSTTLLLLGGLALLAAGGAAVAANKWLRSS
jgi:LPXTG-motif cell wall-anchored protein